MNHIEHHSNQLRHHLAQAGNPDVASSTQRFFTHQIKCLGISNGDVMTIADDYLKAHPELTPQCRLDLTERLLAKGEYHEEIMLGFALIRKVVKRHFDDGLLKRFHFWLERYVSNWAQCDDLCLKVIYPFFLSRAHLITQAANWIESESIWCRRAGNVALAKFVQRKISRDIYHLPLHIVFENSQKLLDDPEPYVQKSVGWLLKEATKYHKDAVVCFIKENMANMQRLTLRYAIERLDPSERKTILALQP